MKVDPSGKLQTSLTEHEKIVDVFELLNKNILISENEKSGISFGSLRFHYSEEQFNEGPSSWCAKKMGSEKEIQIKKELKEMVENLHKTKLFLNIAISLAIISFVISLGVIILDAN